MTQEERDLLMTDLCGRIPYGVHVLAKLDLSYDTEFDWVYQTGEFEAELEGVNTDESVALTIIHKDPDSSDYLNQYVQTCPCTLDDIKPYLRPMTDMTEEEFAEYQSMLDAIDKSGLMLNKLITNVSDWLNAKHFDYRYLIPKGLALVGTKEMYEL